jgi:hypothetical protein
MITFENVVEYNRIITGDGAFKRNGEVSLKQILSAPPPATISAVCQIGYLVALGQYFSDGNHRTGVLTIHLKLIEEADLVSRKKSYLIYGFLDDALALHDKGAGGNLTKLTDFIGNGGFIPLKDTPKKEEYRARYRNEKIAEVLALDALLPQIGRKPVAINAPIQAATSGRWMTDTVFGLDLRAGR